MTISSQELQAATFGFDSSFQLTLADGQHFAAEKVLRILPKKRLVVSGTWQGKPCVAKVFFDEERVHYHVAKELSGIQLLQTNNIPTPVLYYQGKSADGHSEVLIFERILASKNLQDIWQEKQDMQDVRAIFEALIIELATQHVLGVLQHDLHFKNFLVTEKIIYTLDAADIVDCPPLLPKEQSIDNLALFLSQLGVGHRDFQHSLFMHYAKARGWQINQKEHAALFKAIEKWNRTRWQQFEKKLFRSSSTFASMRNKQLRGVYDRSYAHPEFLAFLSDPEGVFQQETTTVLKAGRSATVIKVTLDQHEFVVKRYNLKNTWHRLRRAFRTTRAAHSWRLAHKLHLFGVPTAKPIAFMERHRCGFSGQSYYVTEYISGGHAGDYFNRHQQHTEKTTNMVQCIIDLLKNITSLHLTHGDLKITNFLIDNNEKPVLIDLDGSIEHHSLLRLRRRFNKEIQRFLKNFQHTPALMEQFKQALH